MSTMTTQSSSVVQKRMEDCRAHTAAIAAALAIFQMDPAGREDLADLVSSLNEAVKEQDTERQQYILDSIAELFFPHAADGAESLENWERVVADSTPQAKEASKNRQDENAVFMRRYHDLKAKAGLRTQQQVADACGLSINTVNAIEQSKVKPQARTVQKLAVGFNVNLDELLG